MARIKSALLMVLFSLFAHSLLANAQEQPPTPVDVDVAALEQKVSVLTMELEAVRAQQNQLNTILVTLVGGGVVIALLTLLVNLIVSWIRINPLGKKVHDLEERINRLPAKLAKQAIPQAQQLIEAALVGKIKKEVERFEEEQRQSDPRYIPIRIPKIGLEPEKETLERVFKNVMTYPYLDNTCLNGVVIISFPDETQPEQRDDILKIFEKFIDDHLPQLHMENVGFVLYVSGRPLQTQHIQQKFPNMTFANSITTLGPRTLEIATFLTPK